MRLIRTKFSWRILQLPNRLLTLALAIDPALRRSPDQRVKDARLLPRR